MSERHYLPAELKIHKKEDILPYYNELIDREIQSLADFKQLLADISELESVVSEDHAWRYINMTCDTQNKDYEKSYLKFVQDIQPHLAPLEDGLNRKIVGSPYTVELESDSSYHIYFRGLKSAVELFREENVQLQADLQSLAQEYSAIQGAMEIEFDNQTYTMQQASNFLLKTDRSVREKAWKLMNARRQQDTEKLETLFDEMLGKRHEIAINAGFSNFRDYMFKALGRFDYTAEDCFNFHNAIEKVVVPRLRKLVEKRKQLLRLDELKPWDMGVDPQNREPLKPFETGDELLNKSLKCLGNTHPFFKDCIETMKDKNLLDLDSRKGKAPGGYNYPLAESNLPFIFMNASGNMRDVETMVHEAGHAVHSFLMAPLSLNAFKNTPSEVAELASMSMELLSMDGWAHFFEEESELTRAKLEQLEGIISTLPWIATVDCFQHWIYENPKHSRKERKQKWLELNTRFGSGMIDYTGYEEAIAYSWHKQLHIFEIPFYYIEYGFAQLGAIGMWKLYRENPVTGLEKYMAALKLGYTQSIPDIYKTAGLNFSFTESYVAQLFEMIDFAIGELEK